MQTHTRAFIKLLLSNYIIGLIFPKIWASRNSLLCKIPGLALKFWTEFYPLVSWSISPKPIITCPQYKSNKSCPHLSGPLGSWFFEPEWSYWQQSIFLYLMTLILMNVCTEEGKIERKTDCTVGTTSVICAASTLKWGFKNWNWVKMMIKFLPSSTVFAATATPFHPFWSLKLFESIWLVSSWCKLRIKITQLFWWKARLK